MPQDFLLFEGGVGPQSGNTMFQSRNPEANPITGYADHQRRRSYQVTRQLSFRGSTPQGGLAVPVSNSDIGWYTDHLANGGPDVQVGDYLDIIVLPRYTRLEFVYAQVMAASKVSGLTFDLVLRTVTGSDTALSGLTGLGAVDTDPKTTARLDEDIMAETSYIALKVTAVPASGNKLEGLYLLTTAEVVDWGQLDFNGNA